MDFMLRLIGGHRFARQVRGSRHEPVDVPLRAIIAAVALGMIVGAGTAGRGHDEAAVASSPPSPEAQTCAAAATLLPPAASDTTQPSF